MDLNALVYRFGAGSAEPIHLGNSAATVVRLRRRSEHLFYKARLTSDPPYSKQSPTACAHSTN